MTRYLRTVYQKNKNKTKQKQKTKQNKNKNKQVTPFFDPNPAVYASVLCYNNMSKIVYQNLSTLDFILLIQRYGLFTKVPY